MAFKPKTYMELCSAMQNQAEVELNGRIGTIKSIQLEDGSGRNWNVEISTVVDVGGYGEVKKENVPEWTFFREGVQKTTGNKKLNRNDFMGDQHYGNAPDLQSLDLKRTKVNHNQLQETADIDGRNGLK